MYLKYWDNKSYTICMVDLFTAFILGSLIKNKTSDNTNDSVIQMSLDVNLKDFGEITDELSPKKNLGYVWKILISINFILLQKALDSMVFAMLIMQELIVVLKKILMTNLNLHYQSPCLIQLMQKSHYKYGPAFRCISMYLTEIQTFHRLGLITHQLLKAPLLLKVLSKMPTHFKQPKQHIYKLSLTMIKNITQTWRFKPLKSSW